MGSPLGTITTPAGSGCDGEGCRHSTRRGKAYRGVAQLSNTPSAVRLRNYATPHCNPLSWRPPKCFNPTRNSLTSHWPSKQIWEGPPRRWLDFQWRLGGPKGGRSCLKLVAELRDPPVREGRIYFTHHSAATAIASALLGSMSGLRPGVLSVRPSSSTSNMPCGARQPQTTDQSCVRPSSRQPLGLHRTQEDAAWAEL